MVVYSDSSVDQVATVCYMYYLSVTWETMLTYISIVTYTKYVDTKLQLYYTQLMARIDDVEKKFKDIGWHNLIQNSL